MRTTLNIVYALLGIGLVVVGGVACYFAMFITSSIQGAGETGLAISYLRVIIGTLGALIVGVGLLLTRPR